MSKTFEEVYNGSRTAQMLNRERQRRLSSPRRSSEEYPRRVLPLSAHEGVQGKVQGGPYSWGQNSIDDHNFDVNNSSSTTKHITL